MTAHADDMVMVPRAELDALRAENRRLRREAGDREALKRIKSDSGEGRTFTREELAEAWELVSDPVLRFPDRVWDELEGLPQPLRNAAHRAIFHLLEEPVPALADPFPEADPLPGAYRLHLPSDGLTIWYTVTDSPDGQSVIVVQYVKADT